MPTWSYTKSRKDEARKDVRNAPAKVDRLVERAKAGGWTDYAPTFDDQRADAACRELSSAIKQLGEWGEQHAKKPSKSIRVKG